MRAQELHPEFIIIDDFHDKAWVAPVWVFDWDAGVDYRVCHDINFRYS